MNKRDVFIQALKAGRLKEKRWLLSAFSLLRPKDNPFADMMPWDIIYLGEKDGGPKIVVVEGNNGEPIQVDDYEYIVSDAKPMYHVKDKILLAPGDLPNVKEPIETTYGNVVANYLTVTYPFNDKLPFFTGRFGVKDIEKYIEKRFADTPADGEALDPNAIYYDEYTRYRRGIGLLEGLSQICVPSATPRALTRHPDTDKLREELIEKYKDRLHDPATIAKIDTELKKLDREWLEGDRALDFYIKGKSLNVVRKKAHLMIGFESAFTEDGTGEFIGTSLNEGTKIEDIPILANVQREGSYDRGKETALGGAATKQILRAFQNVAIETEDCGTKHTMPYDITALNVKSMVGNNIVERGRLVQLTEDNVGKYLNTTVQMRSPQFCITPNDGFCKTCIGERYGNTPTALATAAANVGSTIMLIFMAATHGVELKTVPYDWKNALT